MRETGRELDCCELRTLMRAMLDRYRKLARGVFPTDPHAQLVTASVPVVRSRRAGTAASYRWLNGSDNAGAIPGPALDAHMRPGDADEVECVHFAAAPCAGRGAGQRGGDGVDRPVIAPGHHGAPGSGSLTRVAGQFVNAVRDDDAGRCARPGEQSPELSARRRHLAGAGGGGQDAGHASDGRRQHLQQLHPVRLRRHGAGSATRQRLS